MYIFYNLLYYYIIMNNYGQKISLQSWATRRKNENFLYKILLINSIQYSRSKHKQHKMRNAFNLYQL